MANWAYNSINITGSNEELKKLYGLLENYSKHSNRGHSPLKHSDQKWDNGYIFNIDLHQDKLSPEDEEFAVTIESKWDEPKDTLKHLTGMFKVSIHNSIQEMGNCVYGETYYNDGRIVGSVYLNENEFLEYDEDKDGYIHPSTGECMESEYEYYDQLIENKKNTLKTFL